MSDYKLIEANEEYLDQVADYRREFLEAGSSMDGTGALRRMENPREWLANTLSMKKPETCPEGRVPATQFICVRQSDNRLCGMIQVRHILNDYLKNFGGHIGYSVRPSERRRGIAHFMLETALGYCAEIGIESAMVTCLVENEGSRKTILKSGGVYSHTAHEPEDNEDLEIYFIDTKGKKA